MNHTVWIIPGKVCLETLKACKKKATSVILENSYALSVILFIDNSSRDWRHSSTTQVSSLSYSSRKVADSITSNCTCRQSCRSVSGYDFVTWKGTVFVIDRLITLRRAKKEVPLLSFRILQSEITEIVMYRPAGFIYKSGQYVKVACLGLNKKEFHPFTITSSPQDDFISLHIRAIGKVFYIKLTI